MCRGRIIAQIPHCAQSEFSADPFASARLGSRQELQREAISSLRPQLVDPLSLQSIPVAMVESIGSIFYRKFLIFFIGVFLPAWTLSKVPLYLAFEDGGSDAYDARGLGGSINLEQWVEGYRSSKLHSPPCNFLLVHIAFGITVLVMMALTIYNVAWRRKYGNIFFTFSILLGVHTIPSALGMHALPLRILFTFTCLLVITAAVFGFFTLANYEENPVKAEKHLRIEYGLITFAAWGAGFAEFTGIAPKLIYRFKNGAWKTYATSPDPDWGKSIYFRFPESVGVWIFMLTMVFVWMVWPMMLLSLPEQPAPAGSRKESKRA